jgi:hypothetical protein
MKKVLILSLAVFMSVTSIVLNSCKVKPCDGEVCANSGICEDGVCKCPVGYEGVRCETTMRDKFLGLYSINEDGSLSSADQYNSAITSDKPGLLVNEVNISSIQNDVIRNVRAVVKNDTIYIPNQQIGTNNIEGWGWIKGTNSLDQHYYTHATITFKYRVINALGEINKYGYPDVENSSTWSK